MRSPATRRRFLATVLLGTATSLSGCMDLAPTAGGTGSRTADANGSGSPSTGDTPDAAMPDSVGLEPIANGLQAPVAIAFAPDADRRYVADQTGRIFVHESGGLRDDPLLDLRDATEVGGEKGLLGIALHPDFSTNRRLFVRYSAPRRSGTPRSYSHTFVLSEFSVSGDGRRAEPDSERTILEIPEPQSNHNAGDVAFGPNGFLYVPVGDGGNGGDRGNGHVEDWYDAVPGGNGQDVTQNLLGSVLRLDVDARADGKAYAIPDDNPLVGREGLDELYAWGFRNPWRLSFDGEDLYVGDVGQGDYEEVDVVARGGNYGWNVKEGTHCYGASTCPDVISEGVRDGEPLVDPIVEYPHSGGAVSGISVIGGYLYRGSSVPSLTGTYVFGDLSAGGRLFVATPSDDGGLWSTRVLDVDRGGDRLDQLYSFGRDADGELYVLGTGADGGTVSRLVSSG